MREKDLYLKDCLLVPYALNPENPRSRFVEFFKDKNQIHIYFNMRVKNPPECAAVVIILPKHEIKLIKIEATLYNNNSSIDPYIYLELRNQDKIKYYERNIAGMNKRSFEIAEDTSEIVFTCWRSINECYEGEMLVKFYEVCI